ncbi:hypothetical protein PMAYCL1PPCAC_27169, partial [Pristionchus mayeri]
EQKEKSQQADNAAVENPLNKNRSSDWKSPLSSSSLFSSADEESRATEDFCEAFRRLCTVENPSNLSVQSSNSSQFLSKQKEMSQMAENPESIEFEEFCRAFRSISTVNTQMSRDEKGFSEIPSLSPIESLPWPALNRLFYFLRTNEECTDLNNLSK